MIPRLSALPSLVVGGALLLCHPFFFAIFGLDFPLVLFSDPIRLAFSLESLEFSFSSFSFLC